MTIKEIELQLGITRANVRFYEKEGLLFPKRNPMNDYRDYSMEDAETLRKIIFLRNLEVPLENIRLLIQFKIELETVLWEQQEKLKQQQQKTDAACLFCGKLLEGQRVFLFLSCNFGIGDLYGPHSFVPFFSGRSAAVSG